MQCLANGTNTTNNSDNNIWYSLSIYYMSLLFCNAFNLLSAFILTTSLWVLLLFLLCRWRYGILGKDGYTRSHNIRMGIQTQVFVAPKPLQSCRGYNSIISDRNELGCKQQHASWWQTKGGLFFPHIPSFSRK